MSTKTNKYIHLIYSIILSILLITAGFCLITACIGIYQSGDKPFTPESVAAAFSGIAVPVCLCLSWIIGGFVLDGFWPAKKSKPALQKQDAAILARLYEKTDVRYAPPHVQQQLRTMQNRRKLFKGIALGLLAMGTVVFLIYGLNSNNFHQSDITDSMVKAMYIFIPCLAIPFAYGVFSVYYERSSLRKEIELVKQLLANGAKAAPKEDLPKKKFPWLLIVRDCLLILAVAIFVFGFITGGTNDVLTKAINICTECVGLG